MNGNFISIEGGEGAGKSSTLSCIKHWLEEHNIDYVLTREPGGSPLAEEIRSLVLAPREEHVSKYAELLLVFAARVQHIQQTILPALEEGKWVISDRFVDSSYVYQGLARGIDKELIDELVNTYLKNAMPNATILLDVPVEIGLERVSSRGDANRLDGESITFHEKVRNGFLARAEENASRFKVVDASVAQDAVEQQIRKILDELLTQVSS
ncbi:dTMP kinase [Marinomonas piezotolerans]|uniref:Thymidylate kinase n=1 Tax=Marinomonas piezotolerans TaxID=2213058 RepID=A0A370UDU3_9GAMM|nr:dTMP kinase [Marinomonas piezotolerans]RDL45954.1 dTMP kinase [Marinomonas piezotolerans]